MKKCRNSGLLWKFKIQCGTHSGSINTDLVRFGDSTYLNESSGISVRLDLRPLTISFFGKIS